MSDSFSNPNKKDSSRKEITISVRFEGQDAAVINKCSELFGMTRSSLIRKATASYIDLKVCNPKYPNPNLFFSHNMLKILLESASDDVLKKMAKQSYDNGIRDYSFFRNLVHNPPLDDLHEPTLEEEVRSVVHNVFSEKGQNWFQKVHYSKKKDEIIIAGSHDMGEKFSIFIHFLLDYYMNDFNYRYSGGFTKTSKLKENITNLRFVYKHHNF